MNRISSRTVATAVLIIITGCIEPSIGLVLWSDRAAPLAASRALGPDPAAIADQVQRLAADHPDAVKVDTLATTAAGRVIHVVRLAARGGADPDRRPALLLVAGLDAQRGADAVVALNVCDELLRRATSQPATQPETQPATEPATQPATPTSTQPAVTPQRLLSDFTLYVVPLLNPDGLAAVNAPAPEPTGVNARPVDDDRDDETNEDPPNDLNGDGVITMMRVRGKAPTHVANPDEPRLLRKADPIKGELPVFELYVEGIDDDDDGEYNEDGRGGVNLAANFPHLYPANRPDSGPHPVSEVESRALADFVIAHPNIQAVLVFGSHDNLVKPPAGRERDPTGRSYRDLHPDDAAWHGEIARRFRDITGLKGATAAEAGGAFHAWCYAQRAIPAFATSLWWPLEDKPPSSQPATQPTTQPDSQPATQPTSAPASAPASAPVNGEEAKPPTETPTAEAREPAPEPSAEAPRARPEGSRRFPRGGRGGGMPGGPGGRGGPPGAAEAPAAPRAEEKREDAAEDIKWLKYSDARGKAGFVEWQPFPHPTLGQVEIGGFVPGFRTHPPADEWPAIAGKQTDFLLDLAARLPRLAVTHIEIKSAGVGVYEVEFTLVNEGYLPTTPAILRGQRLGHPITVRPDLPPERILGGPRAVRIDALDGGGGRERLRWIVQGDADSAVTFKFHYRPIGEFTYAVQLTPNK